MSTATRKSCNVPISEIEIGTRHRKDLGDVAELAASIERIGLLQPVVLTAGDQLVAGERRIAAYRHLGRDEIPATIIESLADAHKLLEAERDENTCRKSFTPEEAVAIGKAIEESIAATVKRGRPEGSTNGKTFPIKRDESKRLTAIAATAAGMSRPTYEKAREIVEAAQNEPDKYTPLVEEMNTTGKVDGAFKKLRAAKDAAEPAIDDRVNDAEAAGQVGPLGAMPKQALSWIKHEYGQKFDSVIKRLDDIHRDLRELADTRAGAFLSEAMYAIHSDLGSVRRAVQSAKPHQVCPYCNGNGCKAPNVGNKSPCRGTGWTPKGVKGPSTEDNK